MANFGANILPTLDGEGQDKERRQILNYLAMLDEKLRYMFQNVSPEENFSKGAFQNYIKTEERITSLQVEDGKISALITDMEGSFSLMEQRVDGISTTVANAEGNISRIEQRVDGISTTVADAQGNISRIEQRVNGISSTVSNLDGELSLVSQEADKISWLVSGTSASRFELTSRMATLVADEIAFYGVVTFNDLSSSGRTTINGDNISTGEISADYIHLGGFMNVYRTGSSYTLGGYLGYGSGNNGSGNTSGIMISSSDEYSYMIATDSGVRMTYDESYAVHCTTKGVTLVGDYDFRAATNFFPLDSWASLGTSSYHWDTVFADTGEINTSDRRKKEEITYGLTMYEKLFQRLQPVRYKMKNGRSGRFHLGFIAQDIEGAMTEEGINSTEFAGFIKSPIYEKQKESGEEDRESPIIDYNYSLRYGEFIALNTHMIQQLTKRIERLEGQVCS